MNGQMIAETAETSMQDLTLPDPTCARFLTPQTCHIHLGAHDALHVSVLNERIYGGVYAANVFPVGFPDRYIALIYVGPEGKETEVGIVRDLHDFPDDAADLIRQSLARRYFVHTISKIQRVSLKYGFIHFQVETDKGPMEFDMYWQGDKAVDYGHGGKMLLDVDENRYIIPDLAALSPKERAEFRRFIYW